MPLTSHLFNLMECDQCRRKFEPAGGGICSKCRRLLCDRHLHGWFQGWRALTSDEPVCVGCRRAQPGCAARER